MEFNFCKSINKFFAAALLFALLFAQSNLISQTARTSYKILGISVEGNKSADARTIIANSGLKVGDEIQVPGDQTLNAIKKLWALNIFSDVQIMIDKQISDGVFLLIKVDEYPRVEKVIVNGNDEISSSDIEEKINFRTGQILKPQEVQKLISSILKLYEEDGYLNAEINAKYYTYLASDSTEDEFKITWRNKTDFADEYTTEYDPDDQSYSSLIEKAKNRILLILEIKENDKIIVRKIEFIGNNYFKADELSDEFEETEIAKWWKFWSSGKFDKKKYDEDKKLVEKFYLKNGFRDSEILSDSLVYSNDKKDVEIYITVYEGPQFKVRDVVWEGNSIYSDEVLAERLGFKKGDIYDLERFNQNLRGNEKQSDIASLYLDNGYLTFNLKTEEEKIGADSIDITILVSERNQFKVGKVDIIGNDKTKEKVIRRELFSIPGDFFNRALMLRSLQQLANLQFFNVEKLYTEGVDYNLVNDSTVNVAFKVEEKSSDYLNASVGYSGSFGFSGAVGITLTNFSIAEPFQLGGGQILSFNWQFGVGNIYRTFSLGFTEPWLYDTPTLVGFDFFDTRQQYFYDLRQSGGSVKVGRRLKWPDDYFYLQGFFRYQGNNVIDGGNFYREGRTSQFTLGGTISRRNVDNPIFPSLGSSISLDGEISGGPILPGDVDYFKINFKSEWYKRLFNTNKLALYNSAEFGYLEEIVAGTPVQPFEYFFMGGNGLIIATLPLRGYNDRSVGPTNSNGDIIGGRVSARVTSELRFAVALDPIPLYILAFAEAGNVFENINSADFFNLRRSAGFGARILINPIGLIGFDLGYGFDRRAVDGDNPGWIFHFQFGKGF